MIGPNPPTGRRLMTPQSGLSISPARPADVPLILSLINELAEYEKLRHESVATEASIHQALFGPTPRAEAIIARFDAEPAGFALFFHNFSTFLGKPGLYLEDLFVREKFRSRGIGKALLAAVARIAVEEDCYGMHWEVLDWNQKAIELYQALGAEFPDQWRRVMLSGEALQKLAESRP